MTFINIGDKFADKDTGKEVVVTNYYHTYTSSTVILSDGSRWDKAMFLTKYKKAGATANQGVNENDRAKV